MDKKISQWHAKAQMFLRKGRIPLSPPPEFPSNAFIHRRILRIWTTSGTSVSPGSIPITRGVHNTGYRGKLWTMRMFAGFGCAEETNARYKYLLEHGETGLSVAFDYPTLNGYDTDDP